MKIAEKAARIVLQNCLKLKRKESLLLVSDGTSPEFCKTILQISQKLKIESALLELSLNCQYHQEPPDFVAEMIALPNGLILLTRYPLSRSKACKLASEAQTRILSFVNTEPEMLKRIVETNYLKVDSITQKLAEIVTIGRNLRLISKSGSDFKLSLARIQGQASTGIISNPGQNTSLPAGEAYFIPKMNSGDGLLVLDGSMEFIGDLKAPIRLKIEKGVIKRIYGDNEAEQLRKQIKRFGSKARQIIGFGMGTNESAKLGVSLHEDKKVLGTVHISIGNRAVFDKSGRLPNRIDAIIPEPTVVIDGKTIIEDGNLKIMFR